MNSDAPHESSLQTADPPNWEIGIILRLIRRRFWVIALALTITLALAILYLLVSPKVYEAKTVLQVEQKERPVVSTADITADALAAPEVIKTFEQNLDSGELLLKVFKVNKLDQDPRYLAERSLLRPLQEQLARLLFGPPNPLGDAGMIRIMDKRTIIKIRRGSRLIDVSVRAQDPSLAQQLSQSLVSEFIRLNFTQKVEAAKPAYDYLLKEVERLKDKLQKSEQLLQNYKEEQHAVSLEESQNIVVETLKDLNAKLSEARTARIKLESDFARLEAAEGRSSELLSLSAVAASPGVVALKQRIADLEGTLAALGQRYATTSSRYVQLETELQKIKLSLESGIHDAAGLIKASYAAAKDSEEKLLAALQEQEKYALDLNRIAIQYNVLSREVASDQVLYEAVLKQLKETQIIQGVEQGGIRVVESAVLPDEPVRPMKLLVLGLALFLGGGIGVTAAVGPTIYKAPLMSTLDAERQLGLAVLGAIPETKDRRGPHSIFLLDHPRANAAEAIRSLRAMLLLHAGEAKGRVILFASAVAGEGKSFCSLNTAAGLAIDSRRTLLIEADLRSPSIGQRLFGKQSSPGLSDVLSGKADFDTAIQPSKVENLSILTAGSPTDSPSELLGLTRMGKLLEWAALSYDFIILDTPAVLETSDPLRLLIHAHLTCLVARSGATPRLAVARALQLLGSAASGPPVGLVLTHLPGRLDH